MPEPIIYGGVFYPPFERIYDQRIEGLPEWTARMRAYYQHGLEPVQAKTKQETRNQWTQEDSS